MTKLTDTQKSDLHNLLSVIYPRAVGMWMEYYANRNAILQRVSPTAKWNKLPRNLSIVIWESHGFYFKLMPFHGVCFKRFYVRCPVCGSDAVDMLATGTCIKPGKGWFEVGHFFQHARSHLRISTPAQDESHSCKKHGIAGCVECYEE